MTFQELQAMTFPELQAKFPGLYDNVYCGFSCPDGWLPIVYALSEKLHAINQTLPEEQRVRCAQVKEKFGTLRYYYDGGNDEISRLISEAEAATDTVCERCGQPGTQRDGGWIVTMCDTCDKETSKD